MRRNQLKSMFPLTSSVTTLRIFKRKWPYSNTSDPIWMARIPKRTASLSRLNLQINSLLSWTSQEAKHQLEMRATSSSTSRSGNEATRLFSSDWATRSSKLCSLTPVRSFSRPQAAWLHLSTPSGRESPTLWALISRTRTPLSSNDSVMRRICSFRW